MDNIREEQKAALIQVSDYVEKLILNIPVLTNELRVDEKPDTKEFLQQMIQGLGFVIEVTNTIMPLLIEQDAGISKTEMNESIIKLNDALNLNNNDGIADVIDGKMLGFLETLLSASIKIKD